MPLPSRYVNVGPVDGTCSRGLLLTSRLTGTTTLGLEALGAEISISPVHDPGLRPDVFTWMLRVLGVAPDCGVSTIQLLPQLEVLADAVKLTFAPVLLVMESD